MEDIKELQKILNQLGFTDDEGRKLDEDGITGPLTLQACDKVLVSKGSNGELIGWIQKKMINKGYPCGNYGADGIFGNDTEGAVIKFQTDNGLIVDGIIGPQTWRALLIEEYNPTKELQQLFNRYGFTDDEGNTLTEDGIVGPKTLQACRKCKVKYGDMGDIVKWVQKQLICKGYSLEKYGADGIFGYETLRAVKKMQYDCELTPAGIVWIWTWKVLLKVEPFK